MAQTACAYHHRSGANAGIWGHVGGSSEPGESSETTAAREFAEETLGIVKYGPKRPSVSIFSQMESELIAGRYFLRLRLKYTDDNIGEENTHFCDFFLKEFPFDPSVCVRFEDLRNEILRVPEGTDRKSLSASIRNHPALSYEQCVVPPQFLEKNALQWFSLDHIMDLVSGNGYYRDIRVRRTFLPALRVAVSHLLQFVPEV